MSKIGVNSPHRILTQSEWKENLIFSWHFLVDQSHQTLLLLIVIFIRHNMVARNN